MFDNLLKVREQITQPGEEDRHYLRLNYALAIVSGKSKSKVELESRLNAWYNTGRKQKDTNYVQRTQGVSD